MKLDSLRGDQNLTQLWKIQPKLGKNLSKLSSSQFLVNFFCGVSNLKWEWLYGWLFPNLTSDLNSHTFSEFTITSSLELSANDNVVTTKVSYWFNYFFVMFCGWIDRLSSSLNFMPASACFWWFVGCYLVREKCSYSKFFWSIFNANANARKHGPEKLRIRTLYRQWLICTDTVKTRVFVDSQSC